MNISTSNILICIILLLISELSIGMNTDTIILKLPKVAARTGELVCIPIEVENFDQIVAFQFGIKFDPEILSFQGAYGLELPNFRFGDAQSPFGEIRILSTDPELTPTSLADHSTLVELCFDIIGFKPEGTTIEIIDTDQFPIEFIDGKINNVPFKIVVEGHIDIQNSLDCFMHPYCVEEVNIDYTEGIEINPSMLVDDYDAMLGCFNLTAEDLLILDLSDPNATPHSSLSLDCSNLRTEIHLAVLYTSINNDDEIEYSTICQTILRPNIPAGDESCINDQASCYNPNLCRDITVYIDSTVSLFAYSDLLTIDDATSCALEFYTNYTSITLDAPRAPDGFTLTCKDYQVQTPVTFHVTKILEDGGTIDIQLCTSIINMNDFDSVCEDYNLLKGSFPISIITESNGIHPEVRLNLNDTPLDAVQTSIYESKIEELSEANNILEVRPNQATLAGLTTLDIVLSYRALISQKLSPTQAIAADVDLSGSLTTIDLFEMRKAILGIKPAEHIGKAFLVETRTDFSSFDLFEFSNSYTQYEFGTSDIDPVEGLSFEVFHYGDVNNARSNIHKNKYLRLDPQVIQLQDQQLRANHSYTIPIVLSNDEQLIAAGAQLKLKDAIILNTHHSYKGNDFDYHMINPQSFNFIYLDFENHNDIRFELVITPTVDTKLSQVLSIGSDISGEVVTAGLRPAALTIEWQEEKPNTDELCIYPNPASDRIAIDIPIIYIGGQLEIYSILGKRIYHQNIQSQRVEIPINEYVNNGNVVMRISNAQYVQSLKLFIQ